MTTTAPTGTRPTRSRRDPARSGPTLAPALHYTVQSVRLTVRNVSFVLFTVALPVVLYLLFSQLYGNGPENRLASAMIMVSMAAYGSLGAAMSGGAQLAVERRSGWFRQLMITALPPRAFLWARAGVIMVLVLPALLLVFTAGAAIGGVRASVTVWLASLGLMWLGLVPLTVLGIVIGLWVKSEAVQGVTTLSLLVLSLLGGLWFPADMFPAGMKVVAHLLPSYWLAELGRWPFLTGEAFPWTGVLVLVGWSAVLTVVGALGYRRAVASSKR
jgi:ABC-2 type transport system permease protein